MEIDERNFDPGKKWISNVEMTFRHICTEVESAKERVSNVKSNLQKCKMLLHCRREELERLWLEGLEHKHALEILEQIDNIRSVPQQFNKAITRKQYLLASETLMSAVNSWNEELDYIEGLRELKADLKAKREKLYQVLLEEINIQIFLKSVPSVVELKRQGSGVFSPFQRSGSDRHSSGRTRINQIKARKIYLDVTIQNVHNHLSSSAAQDDEMDDLIENILKCVIELKVLPKFKEDLKSQLEEKLQAAINNISQQIIDYSDSNAMSEVKNSALSDFLQLTFNHFRLIVKYYLKILSLIELAEKRNPSSNSKNQISMTKSDVWGQVQAVLQSTLKLYFDLGDSKEMSSGTTTTSLRNDVSSTSSLDVNSFFLKKRQPRQKKIPLFKFEYSLHGLSHVGEAGLEQEWMENAIDKHRFLVCNPNPKNIILIYSVIQEFILEIEDTLAESKCELRKFMDVNVNRIFVQQIYKEISESIDLSRRNNDCWREVISIDETKRLGSPRPIFQGVALIGRSVLDVLSLAKDLPSHSEQLLRILDPVLTSYRESCFEMYGNILRVEEKRIISATMVGDEDIKRLLKSLPNWTRLQERKEKRAERIDESPEDVRSQNVRESDLFVGLFGGKTVHQNDIVGDTRFLKQLSRFHESMEWMSEIICSIASLFQSQFQNDELSDQLERIRYLASLYQELGDMCLLLLYLEIRVQAFYYLSPIPQKADFAPGIDSQVSDPEVLQLSKDLAEMEIVLTATLQPIKVQYLFEGLGQLISTVLIRGAHDIRRINDNGVKRMCRNIFHIQQTVSSITKLAEVGLDQARDFYEIFLHPIQELFDRILEKGPQFRELDYINAVQLLYRSKPGAAKEPVNEYLTRLSNILGDVGVTV